MNIVQKLISSHLVSGKMVPGSEISIKIDQTLTQDSTGTMAYLQFEAMGIPRVKTKRSVAYIDHNMLQASFENAEDHRFIESVAKKYGIYFSKPGNGICHQVHLERFGVPGMTLLGSDSHTPTGGGLGMLAIGAGGLDVAVAMGGGAYFMQMPAICRVNLEGKLQPWVSAKDIILEVLRILGVKGGVSKILEYCGEGVKSLTVPERATITNMGAELGATTSVFPSDERTLEFLRAQGRESDYSPLYADEDAGYDETITIDLSKLEPLVACPHSPDNVKPVREIAGLKVDQVAIGSCTNSSYFDMMKVAEILKGQTVAPNVSLVIAPGSKQVLTMLAENGGLADIISSGARILESSCGPCIGMGQAPSSNAVSLRTFNRNFEGRSGTRSAKVYLLSPESAAVSAIKGVVTDPRDFGTPPNVNLPERFTINDNSIIEPAEDGSTVNVVRGDNIKEFPVGEALHERVEGEVLVKLGDNITTDHIMPSNASLLPYRSNIPYLSDYCLAPCDKNFSAKAKEKGGGFIVAGQNYGQGSSREHAALVPLYLGIKGVIACSFARIHVANLINSGILPLVVKDESDLPDEGDKIVIDSIPQQLSVGSTLVVNNLTSNNSFEVNVMASERQKKILMAGGLLNFTKANN